MSNTILLSAIEFTEETLRLLPKQLVEKYSIFPIEKKGDVNSEITMDSLAFMRLQRDFGSFDDWQKDFMACCAASRCGWAVTYLNTYTQKYMNCVIDLHSQQLPAGCYPIIVMDVWQHSYYRDYLKDVTTYTRAMMKLLRWPVIEERVEKADKLLQVLRS